MDASDRLRRLQDLKLFQGWAIQQQTLQPGVNVSTCSGFTSSSTIHKFVTYDYASKVTAGLVYFSTCQGSQ
jgi:hypothetical protein